MKLYEEWVDRDVSLPLIVDFEELMEEVLYAFEEPYPIYKTKEGVYIVHKLTIGRNWTEYKGHYSKLNPHAYDVFNKFMEIKHEI